MKRLIMVLCADKIVVTLFKNSKEGFMMKKLVRFLSAVMAICLTVSLYTLSVAAHTSPKNGKECNNTLVYYEHLSTLVYSTTLTSHQIISYNQTVVCNKKQELYYHNQRCNGCDYLFTGTYAYPCRITHTQCPTETNEPH